MRAIFFRRLVAHAVDSALFYAFVFGTQFTLLRGAVQPWWNGWQFEAYLFGSVTLPVMAYYALSESSAWQATLGKRLLGLRVTGTDVQRLPLGRAFARAAVRFLPFEIGHVTFALPQPIWAAPDDFRAGFLLVLALLAVYLALAYWHPRGQSVHDIVAGAQVTGAPVPTTTTTDSS